MYRWIRRVPIAVCLAGLVGLFLSRCWADPWNTGTTRFRAGVLPLPLGTSVNEWRTAQAAAADADRFVIYRHEWLHGGKVLGPYGRYHLQQIARRLTTSPVPVPVVIQIDVHDEKLNAVRQVEVINHLLAAGVADAANRVVIAFPQSEGLFGDSAPRIYLQQFQAGRGAMGGAAGLGGSGNVGGSLGGSFGGGVGISGGAFRGGY